jgi:DNA repair protein RadC
MSHPHHSPQRLFLTQESFLHELRIRSFDWLEPILGVFGLDENAHLILDKVLFEGSMAGTIPTALEILKQATQIGCHSLVVYRWVPTATTLESEQDRHLTRLLLELCPTLGIRLQDYLYLTKRSNLTDPRDLI